MGYRMEYRMGRPRVIADPRLHAFYCDYYCIYTYSIIIDKMNLLTVNYQ